MSQPWPYKATNKITSTLFKKTCCNFSIKNPWYHFMISYNLALIVSTFYYSGGFLNTTSAFTFQVFSMWFRCNDNKQNSYVMPVGRHVNKKPYPARIDENYMFVAKKERRKHCTYLLHGYTRLCSSEMTKYTLLYGTIQQWWICYILGDCRTRINNRRRSHRLHAVEHRQPPPNDRNDCTL